MKFQLLEPRHHTGGLDDQKPNLLNQLHVRMLKYGSHFYEIHKKTTEDGSIESYLTGAYLPTPQEMEAVKQIYSFAINHLPLTENIRETVAELKVAFHDLLYAAEHPERIPTYSMNKFISFAAERNFVYKGIGITNQEVTICAIMDVAVSTTLDLKYLDDTFKLLEAWRGDMKPSEWQIKILSHRRSNALYLDEVPMQLQDCVCRL